MAVTWGNDTAFSVTQTGINNVTEEFLDTIDLSGALSAHIQLEIDNEGGSKTDDVIISIYATLDATSEVFDDEPYMTFVIVPDGVALERHPLVVSGVFKFRIGALSTGGTDTYAVGGDYRVRLT